MPSKTEFLPLAEKLVERTKEGKIDWKGTYDGNVFICALDGKYSFDIEKGRSSSGRDLRTLRMKDMQGEEVVSLKGWYPTTESSTENDELYEVLDELFDRARRFALDVDKKIVEVSKLLDKLGDGSSGPEITDEDIPF